MSIIAIIALMASVICALLSFATVRHTPLCLMLLAATIGCGMWFVAAVGDLSMTHFAFIMLAMVVITAIHAIRAKEIAWVGFVILFAIAALAAFGWLWAGWWILAIYVILFFWAFMSDRWLSVLFIAAMFVTIVALIVGMSMRASAAPVAEETTTTTSEDASIDTSSDEADDTTIAFDPATELAPTEAQCTSDELLLYSGAQVKPGSSSFRQFSTAVSVPFAATDSAAATSEMTAEICGNPTVLDMVVKEMASWTDADIKGADSNKAWLDEIRTDIDENGLESFIEGPVGARTVTATYQQYATAVNTVLLRAVPEGKKSLTSVKNWELSPVADPYSMPVVQVAKQQENKPAWTYAFTSKMGTCLLRFGFNTEDKRMERFNCEKPQATHTPTEKPTKPSTPTKKPTSKPTSTPTEKPTDKPTSTPTEKPTEKPKCTFDCPKDKKDDVPPPDGVTPKDVKDKKPSKPSASPSDPAKVVPDTKDAPSSTQQAPGADKPTKPREIPSPATGTRSDGSTGSVNPPAKTNTSSSSSGSKSSGGTTSGNKGTSSSSNEGVNMTDPGLPAGF